MGKLNWKLYPDLLKNITFLHEQTRAYCDGMTKNAQEVYQILKANTGKFNEFLKSMGEQMQKLVEQYKKAIEEGINNFESPEKYRPEAVQLHPWTEELALREGFDLLEKLKANHFSYMYNRYNKGLTAHIGGEYQLSIFTFLSMIDGMLKEFCKLHKENDCRYNRKYPTFEQSLNHLIKHYQFEVFVKSQKFKERLDAFFAHRHQIMHGDRYTHFDKNISTVALLFLALVYSVVENELKESSKSRNDRCS